MHVVDSNDNVTNLDTIENSKVIPSFHIKGIKFNNKYFMFDIELCNLYIILDEPSPSVSNVTEPNNEIVSEAVIESVTKPLDEPNNEIKKVDKNEELEDSLENLENNIEELNLQTDNLENANININNRDFYKVYELINNKIKEDIIKIQRQLLY